MKPRNLAIIGLCFVIIYALLTNRKRYEQFANNVCVVYKLHSSVGMFSDIGFLTEAYIFAKKANLPFYIDSSNWSYKVNKGWHDYFSSLTEISDTIQQQYSQYIVCSHNSVPSSLKTHKLKLGEYEKYIREILIVNQAIQNKLDSIRSVYGEYEAIYIRRGDKIADNESPYVSTEHILNQCSFNASLPIYVQSDDYKEVENVKRILNKPVLSTTPSTKQGANESDRSTMSMQQKEQDTQEFLIGTLLCCMANKCYVDTKSNVSRFIKVYSPKTVEFYTLANEKPNYSSEKEISESISFERSFH